MGTSQVTNYAPFRFKNTNYVNYTASQLKTAMSGVYLYYELANEIVISVDGNEKMMSALNRVKRIESAGFNQLLDFKDTLRTNNVVFNFNKTTKMVSFTGTSSASGGRTATMLNSNIRMTIGHKYYLKNTTGYDGIYISQGTNTSIYKKFPINGSSIFSNTTINGASIVGYNTSASGTIYDNSGYIELIDLTEWFGEGNEPSNLDTVESYLDKDFYDYQYQRLGTIGTEDSLLDVKMLGWSVPAHMGIKNTITAYGLFQQNVGRIKIKMHTWNTTAAGIFNTSLTERSFGNGNFNVTSNNYPTHTISHSTGANIASLVAQYGDGIYINSGSSTIFIADSRYSTNTQFVNAVGDEYLYYELATKPAAINIDGNEATLPQGVDDASGLTLTSSNGTISNVHMVKIGKLVYIQLVFNTTKEISQGTVIITGFNPLPVDTGIMISTYTTTNEEYKLSLSAINGYLYYFGQDRIPNNKEIRIAMTYISI